MRKTIFALNLGSLSNAKHFTINKFTATALTMFAYVSENFAREIAAFMKALEYENKIYEKVDRTFYNQAISQEVPAVMPAEDTSYYEMPAPEEEENGGSSSGGSGSNQDWDV